MRGPRLERVFEVVSGSPAAGRIGPTYSLRKCGHQRSPTGERLRFSFICGDVELRLLFRGFRLGRVLRVRRGTVDFVSLPVNIQQDFPFEWFGVGARLFYVFVSHTHPAIPLDTPNVQPSLQAGRPNGTSSPQQNHTMRPVGPPAGNIEIIQRRYQKYFCGSAACYCVRRRHAGSTFLSVTKTSASFPVICPEAAGGAASDACSTDCHAAPVGTGLTS